MTDTPTAELVKYEGRTAGDTLALAPAAWSLAQKIAGTDFVPSALRNKPEAVLACILAGNEVGISPMQALAKIHVIQGRPAMAAELMRALVFRAGHELWIEESTVTRCTVGGKRRDSERETRVTWTDDDATRANLKGKDNWKQYPAAMLLARATAQLCRGVFPDVLAGISYTIEEIADGADFIDLDDLAPADAEVADKASALPPGDTTPPAGTVTQRARAKAAATRGADTPDQTEPDSEPPAAREEPPLPGEDDEIVDAEIVPDAPAPDPLDATIEPPDAHEDARTYSGPQLVAMKFADRGITDRDQRLRILSGMQGRPIGSGNELGANEIARVLDLLNDETLDLTGFDESLDKPPAQDPPVPPRRRRAAEPEPSPPAPIRAPEEWTADEWRDVLAKRGVKVTEAMRELTRLAEASGAPTVGTLEGIAGSGLADDLLGFVEDLSLSRKGGAS